MVCYACDRPATTREHVPPQCLFPERKDAGSERDCRSNLITVASCDIHNVSKSPDDTYLLWVLTTNLPANSIAEAHVLTKLARAHHRRPALGNSFFEAAKDVTVEDSATGATYEGLEVPLDGPRFYRILELISRGIYRHHFGATWLGSVRVHADFVAYPDSPESDALRVGLFEVAQKLFASLPKHGENQDVFWYKALEDPSCPAALRLCFYGACTATAIFQANAC